MGAICPHWSYSRHSFAVPEFASLAVWPLDAKPEDGLASNPPNQIDQNRPFGLSFKMSKFKPFLITAAIVLIVLAVVSRVASIRRVVFNQSA